MRFAVAQLGARMHYAVPRLLHEAGMLARFYTDICAVKGWPQVLPLIPRRWRSGGLKRLLGRQPVGVPGNKVRAFTGFGWAYARRRAAAGTPAELTAICLAAARRFCELVIRDGLADVDGVFTFNTAGLELLRHARERKCRTVVEQTIAPAEIEHHLLAEERDRFPGWEESRPADEQLAEVSQRERSEWEQADLIVCGSEFVRQGIEACGGPAHRCVLVPYGVDERFSGPIRQRHEGPLRILTVGAVGLRKGSPYVLEAARLMNGHAVFRMVGPVGVSRVVEQELRRHIDLTGPVPRSEILGHYAWADVLLLPSLCEGSATATYEALASGLPVLCTPNTGSTVRHGLDGFVVPIRDPGAIVTKLEDVATRRDWLHEMSGQALEGAQEFTFQKYKDRLVAALTKGNPDGFAKR